MSDLQPDIDSRNVPTPVLSQTGFPPPTSATEGPGIGTAWLGLSPTDYQPAGGVDPDHPHLFHLQAATADYFDGGSLQGAHSGVWPILTQQKGAVYLARLAPGGVREPHWHPSAWEMNVVLSGRVTWSFVGPNSSQDVFEGGAGDVIFAPQGHFHYFENASETEDLIVLIVFNADSAEPLDDVPLAQSMSSMPPHVLAAVFGVDESVFAQLPRITQRTVIVDRRAREG